MVKSTTMTTTRENLVRLMSLIDNNAANIKEGDYLTICNLMRDLHRDATQPQTAPTQPTPSPRPRPQWRPVVRNLTPEFDHVDHPDYVRLIVDGLNQIQRLRSSTPRVCLRHKLTVLRTLDLDLVNNTPPTGLTQTQWVHALEQAYFAKYPDTPVNYLSTKYRELRARVNTREVDNLRLQVGQMRANLDAQRRARQAEQDSGLAEGTFEWPALRITSLDHHMVPP